MRTAIHMLVLSLMLTLAAGCASQSKRPAAPDLANDPAYTPPGSMNIAIGDASRSNNGSKTTAEAMPQPNKREVQKHSIRAAMSMY